MSSLQTLTVYLGSSGRCRPVFKEAAKSLGALIGARGKTLVYGGMDAGLMGIVASAALEHGAEVTGIIPKSLKDSERIHPSLSETILVPDLWERKLKMFKRADAIVNLAGGFGTIDEMLEALHWAALGSHAKPIVIVNTDGYWDEFIAFLRLLPDLPQSHLIIADNEEHLFEVLNDWTPPEVTGDETHLPHFEDIILQDTDAPLIIEEASVANGYLLATALGLKQLGKHDRHIGILNKDGAFDYFLSWIEKAQTEKFVTDHCTKLFNVSNNKDDLITKLAAQKTVTIDLHQDKWGPSETETHIEIKETP